MPIKIPNTLPAKEHLVAEGIDVIEEFIANRQDIRPLSILLVNLMPKKEETEMQFLRLLGSQSLQLNVEFLHMASRTSTHTSPSHLKRFYTVFDEIKDKYYDGLIVTGAPVEHLQFEEVEYFEELNAIFEWSKSHVYSSLHICWGAQARLFVDYGIEKSLTDHKVFGVFDHTITSSIHPLTRGFDDVFKAPHSRHTCLDEKKLSCIQNIDILAKSDEVGTLIACTKDLRNVFITGHIEYDRDTLSAEYQRDVGKNAQVLIPKNYYPNNDVTKTPKQVWRSSAYLFFHNWINEVYQRTPYHLEDIQNLTFN